MRTLIAVLLTLTAVGAHAAPFLQADPIDPNGSGCIVTGLPAVIPAAATVSTVAGVRVCRWDLAALPVGSVSVTVVVKSADPLWSDSPPTPPFPFTRPVSPTAPATLHLLAQ
jgi:hypothetical protein